MTSKRWQQRSLNSNWGEFGPEDQRGRMNYGTREKLLPGAVGSPATAVATV